MPFDFVCPHCHSKTLVDDRYRGQSGPCADCGRPVTMPGGTQRPLEGATAAKAPPAAGPVPRGALWRYRRPIIQVVIGAVLLLGLMAAIQQWVSPVAQQAFQSRQRNLGLTQLQTVARALNAYRRQHGSYPTPIVRDANNKPLYSWRVLILPQLGYASLYQEFQLDQSWDSPTNINLISRMPPVYAMPGRPSAGLNESNIALITGPGTLFPHGAAPVNPDAMQDMASETLLVIETRENGQSWTEPVDLDTVRGVKLGNRPMQDVGGNYDGIALGVTADETRLEIDASSSPANLDALITPNGGETIDSASIQITNP